jgi:thiamine-phosphate pyrophosphorylase
MAEPIRLGTSKPIICYVTDRKALGSTESTSGVLEKIRAAVAADVSWVQIREKDMPARDLLSLARQAIRAGRTQVFISDRLDVALTAGAAGVHLGHESAPAREVVRWCRNGNAPVDFRIGVSCHSLEEAREAESAGANYVFFGPVFETPSKQPFGPPQGIDRLVDICRAVRIPVMAIGGINEKNAVECIRAGAAGVAAIRLFQDAAGAGAVKDAVENLWRLGGSKTTGD